MERTPGQFMYDSATPDDAPEFKVVCKCCGEDCDVITQEDADEFGGIYVLTMSDCCYAPIDEVEL